MAGLDNKISNVLGAALPYWLKNQIQLRSQYNTQSKRDDLNVLYLANKTAWVRLVSSININGSVNSDGLTGDMDYFKYTLGISNLSQPEDLAKNYILFGGTSNYINSNQNKLRFGLGQDGSYGMLGDQEVQKYGYRPMPGITDVKIETQGRLGSIKMATINFKVWDKMQLDVMDALYFKLGYTMLLEWGHTFYVSSGNAINSNQFNYSEFLVIDPFQTGMTKEKINLQIAKNVRSSEGNYDGMLGIVTNFNFSFNQEGGYDCNLKIIGLGSIGDSLKINNPSNLPNVIRDQVKAYLQLINKKQQEAAIAKAQEDAKKAADDAKTKAASDIQSASGPKYIDVINEYSEKTTPDKVFESDLYSSGDVISKGTQIPQTVINTTNLWFDNVDSIALTKFKKFIATDESSTHSTEVTLDLPYLNRIPGVIGAGIVQNSYAEILAYDTQVDINQWSGVYWDPKHKISYLTNKEMGYSDSRLPGFEAAGIGTRIDETQSSTPRTANWIQYDFNETIYRVEVSIPNYIEPTTNNFPDNRMALFTPINKNMKQTSINEVGSFIAWDHYNIRQQVINALNDTSNPWKVDTEFKYNSKAQTANYFAINYRNGIFLDGVRTDKIGAYSKGKIVHNNKYTLGVALYKTIKINADIVGATKQGQVGTSKKKTVEGVPLNLEYTLNIGVMVTDATLIKEIDQSGIKTADEQQLAIQQNLDKTLNNIKNNLDKSQSAEAGNQQSLDEQIDSSLKYQSNLELAIKAIELYSLTQAVNESNLDLGGTVKSYSLSTPTHRNFLSNIMKYGVFNQFLDPLFDDTINDDLNFGSDDSYVDNLIKANDDVRFKILAKYGFNSALMGGKSSAKSADQAVNVPPVNYSELTTVYVVPYEINQPTEGGGQIIHPVYVQLGFLLMIMNAMSTIYESEPVDSNTTSPQNKPLVYLDFNPETNFCLTNTTQFTTNPFNFLIPLQATLSDYKTLFSAIDDSTNEIKAPTEGSATKLYDPQKDPNISGELPKFRAGGNKDAYRGKTMKILVSCEYILDLMKGFSDNNGLNKVFLKPFLDQLVMDMNKSLGAMNIFRVAYDDSSNCFSIVDDQVQPLADGEIAVSQNATDQIPVYGVNSIAKSLNIQTEISSNLSNMVAISANSNASDQSANSTNASSFGFINNSYRDRYIPVRKDLTADEINPNQASESPKEKANFDSVLKAQQKFNAAIRSFYDNSFKPSKDDVSQATNYYIERSTKTNNQPGPTRSSAMIPVSVNFTTDGISGFHMGQAFTLPSDILPYTYSTRHTPTLKDVTDTNPTADVKVAFATVGLSHTIQGNVWDTSIKGNMILIKDQNAFSTGKLNTSYSQINSPVLNDDSTLAIDSFKGLKNYSNYPAVNSSLYSNIKFGGNTFLGNPMNDDINPQLLSDVNTAALNSGLIVTITTAITGHKIDTSSGNLSRHTTGNAVDVAIINGNAVSPSNTDVPSFVKQLVILGYAENPVTGESGHPKVVLTYPSKGHSTHVHISNKP